MSEPQLVSTDPNYGLAPPPEAHPEARMSAAVPGTAISSTDPNILHGAIGPKTRQFLDTPLGHPTGVDSIDNLTTPANLAVAALTGTELSRASLAPAANVLAQARAALGSMGANVGTNIKYEVVRSTLQALHVPAGIAIPVAMSVAGFKPGGKGAPAEGAPASAPAVSIDEANAAARAARAAKFGAEPVTPPAPAAPVEMPAASTPPAANTAPAAALTAPLGQALQRLAAKGLSPTETNQALALLKQGVAPEAAEAQILAARPSASSVAPASVAPKVLNELAMAARRAQVTLTQADYDALVPLVQKGATAADAIKQLPALQMQRMPGVMTPEQMAAEIAARKGNRSPAR